MRTILANTVATALGVLLAFIAIGCSSDDSSRYEATVDLDQVPATDAESPDAAMIAADAAFAAAEAADAARAAADGTTPSDGQGATQHSSTGADPSHKYCDQLAEIGRTAFNAKQDGNGIDAVLSVVKSGLAHDPRRQTAAEGVVLVIYGDSSITSGLDAYARVHDACRRST